MIKIKTVLQYKGHPEATRKALNGAVRAGLMELGVDWTKKYLPLHFKPSAHQRYAGVYDKRTMKYNNKKGHRNPMVFSGAMRRQILSFAQIKPSTKKVRVTMSGMRAANFLNRASSFPDFRAELTTTSPDERQRFAQKLDISITRRLNSVKTKAQFRTS